MKLSEITVGTEYAVVPSWTYNNQSARNVDTVRENDVVKATLVSKDKTEYDSGSRYSDVSSFRPAKEGDRSIGVIVKGVDNGGADIYWTTRLADIVAPYANLEPKWNKQKLDEAQKQAEEAERQKKEKERERQIDEEIARSRNSIITTCKELLNNSEVQVDTRGWGLDRTAIVTVPLAEFEQLIEMAYAGKDNY